MVAIKGALFVAMVGVMMWAGVNLGTVAIKAWPMWALVEGGGALGCFYASCDMLYRWRDWVGYRRYEGPRRRMAWSPWR